MELVGFTKTDTIEPGKEQTVTVTVDKEVMKTYDAANAKTYVVDAGDYFFTAASDAHEAINNILAAKGYTTQNGMDADGNAKMTYKTSVDALDTTSYAKATETGKEVTNQFDDVDLRYYDDTFTYLTRNDWTGTFPATYADGSMTASDELLADLAWDRSDAVVNDGSKMPEFSKDGEKKVADAKDAAYDDPIWSELVSELSAEKAMQLVRQGGYATIQADTIGLPATTDKDGTSGISGTLVGGQSAMAYPVEAVMACTWNKDLMYEMGLSLGEDSINTGVAGWYAPGVDIHRSPYSGRNFEYFSEDGYLSGQLAGNEVKGAREKGVITYMKHFALNDQETNRYGGAMFANEQSIRELYLKGFEYTVTIGKTNAAMAGMNRIGARWVGAHKGLMTNVLRDEWGFEGMVITDQASVSAMFYQDIISGLAAGTDLWLNTNKSFWALDSYAEEDGTVTDWTTNATVMNHVARAAQNVIYAVGTSNAMDAVAEDGTVANQKAPWEIGLLMLDIVVFGICGLFIILTSIRWAKYAKTLPKQEEEGDDIVKKNKVVVLVIVAVLLGLLVGGFGTKLIGGTKGSGNAGNSAASDAGAAKGNVYIFGEDKENSYGGTDYDEYQLTLKEDGTYEMVMTEATYAYNMLLAHTSVTTYGTYEKGDSSDGATACKLSEATRIVYNSYSDVGGYNLSYDTDSIDEYPIELPGGIMTEKEDFFAQYGAERTAYLDESHPSQMSFEQ